MTLEQISALTLLECLDEVLPRILNYSLIPEGEPAYQLDVDTEIDTYDRIAINPVFFAKPSRERVESEFAEYTQELIDEENARLAAEAAAIAEEERLVAEQAEEEEAARIQALRDRVATLEEYGHRVIELYTGEWFPNAKAWFRDNVQIHSDGIESLLDTLEVHLVVAQAEAAERANSEALESIRESSKAKCRACEDAVIDYNLKGLISGMYDSLDIDLVEERFDTIMQRLRNNRPDKAKALITAADLSGTIYTEDFRQELISILS